MLCNQTAVTSLLCSSIDAQGFLSKLIALERDWGVTMTANFNLERTGGCKGGGGLRNAL